MYLKGFFSSVKMVERQSAYDDGENLTFAYNNKSSQSSVFLHGHAAVALPKNVKK
jgi:hypothetical protein